MVNVHNVHVWSPYIGLALMESSLWLHTISIMCCLFFDIYNELNYSGGATVEGNT